MSMYTCGWCGNHYQNWEPKCASCGGPMPALPGYDLGEEPPPAPRPLPKGFALRLNWTTNVGAIVGEMFTLIGGFIFLVFIFVLPIAAAFPLLFVALGGTLLYFGRRKSTRTLNAFRVGKAIKGEITDIYRNTSIQINGRSPWRIHYIFQHEGLTCSGDADTFDDSAAKRKVGQPVWVLYDPASPDHNTLYPPIK